jgi:hypothetical protein
MFKALLAAATLAVFAMPASAQLEPYKDYELGENPVSVTTIKVDANMADYYLEGIRSTWIASNKVAKELGHIKDYGIWVSQFPQSGDFNLILTVEFNSFEDLAPSKARYEAFMKAWGEENQAASRETTKTYPGIREITGEYLMLPLMMK